MSSTLLNDVRDTARLRLAIGGFLEALHGNHLDVAILMDHNSRVVLFPPTVVLAMDGALERILPGFAFFGLHADFSALSAFEGAKQVVRAAFDVPRCTLVVTDVAIPPEGIFCVHFSRESRDGQEIVGHTQGR